MMGEGPAKAGRGGDLIDGGVNGLWGLVVGPVGPIAPPQRIEAQLAAIAASAHRADPSARRGVVARRRLTPGQRKPREDARPGKSLQRANRPHMVHLFFPVPFTPPPDIDI